ncbi:OmpA family protein, partial [Flavobacterium rhizosphaerae]
YDIYVIDLAKGTAAEAKNVGLPVNSGKDDFAFSFNDTKEMGFFSSNRDGFDKLYSATPVCGVEAIVMVRDADTQEPIAVAKVSILDEKNNVIETRETTADGKVVYNVDCNRKYTIQVSAEGYENNSWPIQETKGGTVTVNADMKPIAPPVDPIVVSDIYFEFDKSNITKEAAFELDKIVGLMQKYPEMVIMVKAHTDNRGSDRYNMRLSNRRAKSTVQYIISKGISKERISGQGYGESEPLIDCKANCTEEEHAKNRRSEFVIVKKGEESK